MSFPIYEFYRDSGTETLGELPAHWSALPLKRVLAEPLTYGANEAAIDISTSQPRFVRITDVDESGNLRDDTFRSLRLEIAEPYLLSDGDILLARSGATVGKSFIYRRSWGLCCFAGYLIRARPNQSKIDPQFLYFVCQSEFYWHHVGCEQIQATIQNVSAERYSGLIVPCPPKLEQTFIAGFLERETAKIDVLVEEQQRLVALLREKRQAVISDAVTRGLEPNAPMKDSGIEWLGTVPAHWEVIKLNSALLENPCYGVLVPDFAAGGVPMLRITDMNDGSAERAELTTISAELSQEYARTLVKQGDVVLSVVGTLGEALKIGEALEGVNLSRAVARLQPNGVISADFMCWMFESVPFRRYMDLVCVGTAQRVLNMAALSAFRVGAPSVAEQGAICEFLESSTSSIDELVAEAEIAVSHLQERRSALISAAVTGKIDVRGFAPSVAEAA
jgi:type I restriction enzyme S subunit